MTTSPYSDADLRREAARQIHDRINLAARNSAPVFRRCIVSSCGRVSVCPTLARSIA